MSRRLLFVVNEVRFFASHRLILARAATRAGYDVHLAAPAPRAADVRDTGVDGSLYGLPFHPIALDAAGTNPARELGAIASLTRLYRRLRPDIVHQITIKPVLYGSAAAVLARVPLTVSAITGLGVVFADDASLLASARRRLVRGTYRWLLDRAGAVTIVQNRDDAALLGDGVIAPHRLRLIRGSGVDLARFVPTLEPDGVPVVLLASRLVWGKGIEEFVAAARAARAAGVRARFVLAGDLARTRALEESVVRGWVDAGDVEWWGHSDDMPATFARATIVCLPSYREGVPKVLVEAMAAGRPIVTTDVPGCREIVQHDVNGVLVPPRDPGALLDAIRRLLDDPDRRARYSAAGRAIAEAELGEEEVVARTLAIYAGAD